MRVSVSLPWLKQYDHLEDHWLFSQFPVRDIITTFAKIPTYEDCNDALWGEIENRLPENHLLQTERYLEIDTFVSMLMERYYVELSRLIPESDNHTLVHWIGNYAVMVELQSNLEQPYG